MSVWDVNAINCGTDLKSEGGGPRAPAAIRLADAPAFYEGRAAESLSFASDYTFIKIYDDGC